MRDAGRVQGLGFEPASILAVATRLTARVLVAAAAGCSTAMVHAGGYCSPPATPAFDFSTDPDADLGNSREAQMAAVLGLRGVTAEEASRSAEVRARVVERIALATVAIQATSAELDCESERAVQAADYLQRGQSGKVQTLTVFSVVAAALTSIVGVFLSTRSAASAAQDTVAVSGGVLSGSLGLSSLFVHARMNFEHSRNLLTDVWLGGVTGSYPKVVWAYLSRAQFSNNRQVPIRERIATRWRQFRQVGDPATAAVLFGSGGSYDVETLRLRAAMLQEVNAEVELAHQELASFAAVTLR